MKKLIIYELKKIFQRPLTKICVAAVLLFVLLLSFSSYQGKYATDGKGREGTGKKAVEIDREIAERYAGVLTDEKVRQMVSDLMPKRDFHGLNPKYVYQNAMQSAVAARFVNLEGNWNGLGVSDVFGDEEIRIGYVDGWLSTSQDLVKVLIVLILAVIVMTAPVFSGEYGGVDRIILSCRYGRSKCATAKIAACMLSAFTMAAVVVLLDVSIALILYGKEGLSCSILFAQLTYAEQYIPFNITCKTLLGYQVLLAFTGTGSAAGITLWLSAVCKNQTEALALSFAAYFFPLMLPVTESSPLFRLVVLLPIYHTQFISLMSVEQMGGKVLYAVWAVPAALVLSIAGAVLGKNVFGHHQVA